MTSNSEGGSGEIIKGPSVKEENFRHACVCVIFSVNCFLYSWVCALVSSVNTPLECILLSELFLSALED